VKVRIACPFGAIEPFNVSVVGDDVVDGAVVVLLLLPHAAPNAASASSATAGHFIRL
jgi:hypothetical protein